MTEPKHMTRAFVQTADASREIDRRLLLASGMAAAAISMFGLAKPAWSAGEPAAAGTAEVSEAAKYQSAVDAFLGGAEPKMERVTLTAPEIAENGNTVPIGVAVDSPMTADDRVVSILILADGNPEPGVATLTFSKYSAEAMARTRIRLAKTQNIMAIAKMSDGSFYADKKYVKVTIGGCGG